MRAEQTTPHNADKGRAMKAESHAKDMVGIDDTGYAQKAADRLKSIEVANTKPGDQSIPEGFFDGEPYFEGLLGVFEPYQHSPEYIALTDKIEGLRKKEDKEHARRLWKMLNTSRQQEALLKYEQQVPLAVKPEVVDTLTEISTGANNFDTDEQEMLQKALRGEYKDAVKRAGDRDDLLVMQRIDRMDIEDQARLLAYIETQLSTNDVQDKEYKVCLAKLQDITFGKESDYLDRSLVNRAKLVYSEEVALRLRQATEATLTRNSKDTFAEPMPRNPETVSPRTTQIKTAFAQSQPGTLAKAWNAVRNFFGRR